MFAYNGIGSFTKIELLTETKKYGVDFSDLFVKIGMRPRWGQSFFFFNL
jgi:hypothetical protein